MGKNNSKDWQTLPNEYQWRFCTEGYLAHPDGTIKSVDRWVDDGKGGKRLLKGKVLKPAKNKKGYLVVGLHREGKGKTFLVHRLVVQAFLPNPDNLPIINHKDENPLNNRAENLEWCTYEYNNTYGTARQRASKAMKGRKLSEECKLKVAKALTNRRDLSKPVVGIDPNTGKVVVEFPSTMEAGRNGYDYSSVAHCCRGERKTYKGLIWRYK